MSDNNEEIQNTKIVAGQKAPKKPKAKKRRTVEVSVAIGIAAVIVAGAATATIAANSNNKPAETAQTADDLKELKLGYFGNVTHALPVVGVQQGFYSKELGKN